MKYIYLTMATILIISSIFACSCKPKPDVLNVSPSFALQSILSEYERDSYVLGNEDSDCNTFFYSIQFSQSDTCILMNLLGDDYAPLFIPMFGPDSIERKFYEVHGHENNHLYGYLSLGNNRWLFVHEGEYADSLVKLLFPKDTVYQDEDYLKRFNYQSGQPDNPVYTYSIDSAINFQFIKKDF